MDKDDYRIDLLARTVLEMAKRFYADPQNQKDFEEWKKARDAKKEPAHAANM